MAIAGMYWLAPVNAAPKVPEVMTDSVLRFSPTLMPATNKSGFRFKIAYSAMGTASVGVPATAYASCPSTFALDTRIGSKSESDLPTPLFWTAGATMMSLPRSRSAFAAASSPKDRMPSSFVIRIVFSCDMKLLAAISAYANQAALKPEGHTLHASTVSRDASFDPTRKSGEHPRARDVIIFAQYRCWRACACL